MVEADHEKMKVHQEKTEAGVEHYNWAPHIKATHLLTTLQGRASYVLHGDPKGETDEETTRHLRTNLGTSYLATGHHNQLKTQTQDNGESL
jgi:hypothetical protein